MYNPKTDGVTMSLFSIYRTCPTRARMALKGYYIPGNSASLIYGNVFHEAMDLCLNEIKKGCIQAPEEFDREFMKKLALQLHNNFEEEYNASEAKFKQEFLLTFEVMEYLIPQYFKFWAEDFFGPNKKEYIQIEKTFKVPFAGTFLKGKKDGVYLDVNKNGWLLEHKTKSQIKEEALSMTIARDFQNNLYMLAHYLEEKVKLKGVLYNIVRKSSLRQKAGETPVEFARRIGQDISDRPDFYFIRFHVNIPWSHISTFSRKFYKELKNFLAWWESDERNDYEFTGNCVNQFGACPYIVYCDSGRENLEGLEQRELFQELKEKK